jgi:hypothetical protein
MFEWPDWVARLSVFTATGHPYQGWPSWSGLLLLGSMAIVGAAAAAALNERSRRIAG